MAELRKVSGVKLLKILCNKFGFSISRRRGSYVRISKQIENDKIGTVIPMHNSLKIGTIKAILKQAGISKEEIAKFL